MARPRRIEWEDFLAMGPTPGNYRVVGTRGVRHGESSDLQDRLPRVVRKHQRCLGRVVAIEIDFDSSRRRRRRIESERIRDDWWDGVRTCNTVDR